MGAALCWIHIPMSSVGLFRRLATLLCDGQAALRACQAALCACYAAVRFGPGLLCAAGWPTCHVTLCDGQAALCACQAASVRL